MLSDKAWDDLLTKNRGTELTENGSWKKEIGNGRKYGIAKGKFAVPDDIDGCNAEIAEMFGADTFSGMEIPGELSFSGDSERMGF